MTRVAGSGRSGFFPGRGTAVVAGSLFFPEGVVEDAAGNLFVADSYRRVVLKVTPEGAVLTVAGPPELSIPGGLAVDRAGSLFIADSENHRILKVCPEGRLGTAVGTGRAGFSGDGGSAAAAQLHAPWGLAVDREENLYIADAANHRIRKVGSDGTITTLAGTGIPGFAGDGGAATAAQLDRPIGLTVDGQGNLFIVDSLNGRIRKVGLDGVMTTVFGGSPEEDGIAPAGGRYYPASVAVDREGTLLIADPFHHRVWKVDGVAGDSSS